MIDDDVARLLWSKLGERLIAEGVLRFDQSVEDGRVEMSIQLNDVRKDTIELAIYRSGQKCRIRFQDGTTDPDAVNPDVEFTEHDA